jgi:hypothetical protein
MIERYGVWFKSDAKSITAEATTRIVYARFFKPLIASEVSVFIPLEFVDNLCSALELEGSVVGFSEKKAFVNHSSGTYSCKLGEAATLKSEMLFKGERELLGEISAPAWLNLFQGARELHGGENEVCRVILNNGSLEYVGKNGSLSVAVEKTLEKKSLALNAETFCGCLSEFEDKVKLSEKQDNKAVFMEAGDLTVITSQLRIQ